MFLCLGSRVLLKETKEKGWRMTFKWVTTNMGWIMQSCSVGEGH